MQTAANNKRTFPHTPSVDRSYQPSSSSGGGSSSTTTVQDCRNLEAMKRVYAEQIRDQYAHCIGEQMPPAVFRRILLDLIDGTPTQYYTYALDETSLAPRPSTRYMLAIIARLKRERADPESLTALW